MFQLHLIISLFISASHAQTLTLDEDTIAFAAVTSVLLVLFCCCCICATLLIFGYTGITALDCIFGKREEDNNIITDAAIIPMAGAPVVETQLEVQKVRNKKVLYPPPEERN